jgi:hypothetical protein
MGNNSRDLKITCLRIMPKRNQISSKNLTITKCIQNQFTIPHQFTSHRDNKKAITTKQLTKIFITLIQINISNGIRKSLKYKHLFSLRSKMLMYNISCKKEILRKLKWTSQNPNPYSWISFLKPIKLNKKIWHRHR